MLRLVLKVISNLKHVLGIQNNQLHHFGQSQFFPVFVIFSTFWHLKLFHFIVQVHLKMPIKYQVLSLAFLEQVQSNYFKSIP